MNQSAITLNPTFKTLHEKFSALFKTHQSQLIGETAQQEKRQKIETLRKELITATQAFGDPNYTGRDMNRVASEMKRVSGQLEQAIESSDNYMTDMQILAEDLEEAAIAMRLAIQAEVPETVESSEAA